MGMIRSILILFLHSTLIVAQGLADPALQAIDSLPPCGKTCINNAFGHAQQFGCDVQDTACICANLNFRNGIRDCSAQSCPPSIDTSSIISAVDSLCAQDSGPSTSMMTPSTAASSSTVARSVSKSSSSTVGPIPTTGVTGTFTSAVSSTTVESTPRSSTGATSTSLPTSTRTNPVGPNSSRPSSTTPSATTSPVSSDLTASAKVGIGLGVPLGAIICIALGFLVFRYLRHKRSSRLRHHGNMAAAGLYPAVDESADAAGSGGGVKEPKHDGGEETGPHEMHGGDVPAYSRELPGSPGPARSELNARRGSV